MTKNLYLIALTSLIAFNLFGAEYEQITIRREVSENSVSYTRKSKYGIILITGSCIEQGSGNYSATVTNNKETSIFTDNVAKEIFNQITTEYNSFQVEQYIATNCRLKSKYLES